MDLKINVTLFLPELADFVYNNEIYCVEDAARDLELSCRDWNDWSPSRQWFIDNGYAAKVFELCERDRAEHADEYEDEE